MTEKMPENEFARDEARPESVQSCELDYWCTFFFSFPGAEIIEQQMNRRVLLICEIKKSFPMCVSVSNNKYVSVEKLRETNLCRCSIQIVPVTPI